MTNQIEFLKSGEWVMRITADRRIEVNEDVTVTEAAQTVIEAVQKLLEQQTEPVAWMFGDGTWTRIKAMAVDHPPTIPVYTAPPQRKPLTDDEIIEIAKQSKSAEPGLDGYILPISFARAIEQANSIKGKV